MTSPVNNYGASASLSSFKPNAKMDAAQLAVTRANTSSEDLSQVTDNVASENNSDSCPANLNPLQPPNLGLSGAVRHRKRQRSVVETTISEDELVQAWKQEQEIQQQKKLVISAASSVLGIMRESQNHVSALALDKAAEQSNIAAAAAQFCQDEEINRRVTATKIVVVELALAAIMNVVDKTINSSLALNDALTEAAKAASIAVAAAEFIKDKEVVSYIATDISIVSEIMSELAAAFVLDIADKVASGVLLLDDALAVAVEVSMLVAATVKYTQEENTAENVAITTAVARGLVVDSIKKSMDTFGVGSMVDINVILKASKDTEARASKTQSVYEKLKQLYEKLRQLLFNSKDTHASLTQSSSARGAQTGENSAFFRRPSQPVDNSCEECHVTLSKVPG